MTPEGPRTLVFLLASARPCTVYVITSVHCAQQSHHLFIITNKK